MSRPGEMADRRAERAPLGLAALAAALAMSVSTAALAQNQPSLAAPPQPGAPTEMVMLEADEIINDEAAQTLTAAGDVQVRYGRRTLRADRLVYDLNTGAIHAIGNVEVVLEDGTTTYAQEVDADEAMNVGVATELRSRLGTGATLAARAAVRRGEGEGELRNIIYTSCPICEGGDRPPTWSLRARRAIQDRETRTISYQGAVLEIAGVPVLYLPFFAHPDPSVGRASGLLSPEIGRNSRLGAFYAQPYYWAISPSQDATVTLRAHQNVNPLMGIQYRKRFWSGQLEVDTTFTQEQLFDTDGAKLGDDLFRSSVFAEGLFEFNQQWDWGFGVERTYDDFYLRRYRIAGVGERRGPYLGTESRLISQLFALGQDENSYSSIAFVSFQGLREGDTPDLLPVILPYVETEHVLRDPLFGGQVRLQSNAAFLVRDDNPATVDFEGNGGRLSLSASWRRDAIFGPGMVLSPFAQARGDVFHAETAADDYDTFSRGLGLAGVEVSWPFMRPGERFDFVIEPVAMAAVASDAGQATRVVNEDSLAFELDDSNLFRPNGAPNYDLWEPGSRVSAGVRATARAHTGESASIMFGRRWRDQAAAGFTERDNLAAGSSDWVGSVQADLGRSFGAQASFRLDDETLDVQRIDLGVRGAIGRFSGSARYYSINDTLTPIDPNAELAANVGVDLIRGWRMQYGVVRDLDSDINRRQEISAIYEDDCTFLEIRYSREETQAGTIGPDEGIQIRIGLRSLGVFGGG